MKSSIDQLRVVALLVISLMVLTGCEKNPFQSNPDGEGRTEQNGEADSQAGKASPSAPAKIFGGHMFAFEPDDYVGDWSHSVKSDLIRIFILDKETKSKSPINADTVLIRRGDVIFSLDPEEPDEDGKTAVFSLDNKDLAIAMNLGVTVEMTVDGEKYSAKIAAHSH